MARSACPRSKKPPTIEGEGAGQRQEDDEEDDGERRGEVGRELALGDDPAVAQALTHADLSRSDVVIWRKTSSSLPRSTKISSTTSDFWRMTEATSVTMPAPFFGMARSCSWPFVARDASRCASMPASGCERALDGVRLVGGDANGDRAVIGHAAHQVLGVPSATMRPLLMMMARVQTASTSSRMWVETMIAFSLAISRDQLAHLVLLVGIEAVGRLVHDQHLRIVQDRLREADAALEAFGEGLDGLVEHGPEAGPARPRRR